MSGSSGDSPQARPKVTVESAKQVATLTDPGTRRITRNWRTRSASCRSWRCATPTASFDEYGPSEIDDLKPLVDALNKSLADMMVTSEYVGRPRRWATGIELTDESVLGDDGQPDR
jgi:hypothetical protein